MSQLSMLTAAKKSAEETGKYSDVNGFPSPLLRVNVSPVALHVAMCNWKNTVCSDKVCIKTTAPFWEAREISCLNPPVFVKHAKDSLFHERSGCQEQIAEVTVLLPLPF